MKIELILRYKAYLTAKKQFEAKKIELTKQYEEKLAKMKTDKIKAVSAHYLASFVEADDLFKKHELTVRLFQEKQNLGMVDQKYLNSMLFI